MASCLRGVKHIEMLQWFVALQTAVLISVSLKFHRIGGSNPKNVPRKVEGCGRETWNLLEGKVEKHYARVVKRFKQEHDGDGLAWRGRKVSFR